MKFEFKKECRIDYFNNKLFRVKGFHSSIYRIIWNGDTKQFDICNQHSYNSNGRLISIGMNEIYHKFIGEDVSWVFINDEIQ